VKSNFDRRVSRIEKKTADLVSYREAAEISAQGLGFMRDAMVKNLDDPSLVAEILNEMTGHANRMLEPLGYGIGWRMP
jgi:hypothetical protein